MNGTSVRSLGWSSCLALAFLTMRLAAPNVSLAQAPALEPDGRTINAPRPVMDLALLLEARYAKPVTYEDPVWQWRGDVYSVGSDETAPMALWLKDRLLVLPDGLTPAENPTLDAALVGKVLDAYRSQQPDETHFKVTASRLGLHVIPTEFRNADGKLVAAATVLDAYIRVPEARRMASQHLQALCDAVTAATGTSMTNGGERSLDQRYAAGGLLPPKFAAQVLSNEEQGPYTFVWGARGMSARDAVLSLLDSSATTFSWRLLCHPCAKPQDRFCVFNVVPLMIPEVRAGGQPLLDAAGRPKMRPIEFDRVRELPKSLPLPPPSQ